MNFEKEFEENIKELNIFVKKIYEKKFYIKKEDNALSKLIHLFKDNKTPNYLLLVHTERWYTLVKDIQKKYELIELYLELNKDEKEKTMQIMEIYTAKHNKKESIIDDFLTFCEKIFLLKRFLEIKTSAKFSKFPKIPTKAELEKHIPTEEILNNPKLYSEIIEKANKLEQEIKNFIYPSEKGILGPLETLLRPEFDLTIVPKVKDKIVCDEKRDLQYEHPLNIQVKEGGFVQKRISLNKDNIIINATIKRLVHLEFKMKDTFPMNSEKHCFTSKDGSSSRTLHEKGAALEKDIKKRAISKAQDLVNQLNALQDIKTKTKITMRLIYTHNNKKVTRTTGNNVIYMDNISLSEIKVFELPVIKHYKISHAFPTIDEKYEYEEKIRRTG